MKIIKPVILFIVCLNYTIAKGQTTEVEKLNIGIFPITSTATIKEEQLSYIKTKLKNAFENKIRFTLYEGDSLTKSLNTDSLNSYISATEKGKEATVNNPNKIDFLIVTYVNGLRAINQSMPNTSGGYDKGATATTAMQIKIYDLKTNKMIFNDGLFHSEFYKNRTIEEATNKSISSFCGLFKDLINYVFPVELSIAAVETSSKKGIAETVNVKNAEYMYVYIKKGFLDFPNSKFEVYYMNDEGKKEVIGKLEAKEIIDLKTICDIDKGAKEITKKLAEGKTLYLTILDNTIEYYINQKKK